MHKIFDFENGLRTCFPVFGDPVTFVRVKPTGVDNFNEMIITNTAPKTIESFTFEKILDILKSMPVTELTSIQENWIGRASNEVARTTRLGVGNVVFCNPNVVDKFYTHKRELNIITYTEIPVSDVFFTYSNTFVEHSNYRPFAIGDCTLYVGDDLQKYFVRRSLE